MCDHKDRAPRTSLMLMAQMLRDKGGEATLHRVSNLSSSGARISKADDLFPGDRVTLFVGAADPVPATVVWSREGLAGVQFDWAISVEQARQHRADRKLAPAGAGWMTDIRNAYGR